MKKLTRMLSVLLCLALSLGIGCAGFAESALEPIEIKILYGNSMEMPPEDNKIYKKIKDDLGVTMDLEFLIGNSKEKLGVMIASGDYPDMLDAAGNGSYLINSGILLPLEDLITPETTPNLYEFMQPQWNELIADDGHIYFIPNDNREYNNEKNESTRFFDYAFWIMKDILIDADYPAIPTTLDEYFDLIAKYVEKHPTNPQGKKWSGFEIMCEADNWRSFPMRDAWMYLSGDFADGGYHVDYETLEATYDRTTEDAYNYYKKLNEMYLKGLVDPESFVQNFDEYHAKVASGTVLGMFDSSWQLWVLGTQRALGNEELEFLPISISLTPGEEVYFRSPVPLRQSPYNGMALTITNKNPERCLQFLDALCTEEWGKIMWWGIEGEDYLVDENGLYYLTDEMLANHADPQWTAHNTAVPLLSAVTKRLGFYSDGNAFSWDTQLSTYQKNLGEKEVALLNAYGKTVDHQFVAYNTVGLYPDEYSANNIAFEEGGIAAINKQACWDLESEWLPKLIMSAEGTFDSMWEDYKAAYAKIDKTAMVEAVEAGLKAKREKAAKN